MYKFLFKLTLATLLLGLMAGYITLNTEASAKTKEFSQFSSDLFRDLISKNYGKGFKLTSEAPDSDTSRPGTDRSGILPGESDVEPSPAPSERVEVPPERAEAPSDSTQQGDSVDPSNPPPAETDGEGPNPQTESTPSTEDQRAQQEEEEARERIRQERSRREAEETKRKQRQDALWVANLVRDYYHGIGQGDYQQSWAMLAPSFKSRRNLDYQGYECFWRNHQPTLLSPPKTVSINATRAIVYTDWKISTQGRVLYNEPVKVTLTWDDTTQGWLIAFVESRLYDNHSEEPPREHMRPASVTGLDIEQNEER